MAEIFDDDEQESNGPEQRNAERILRLIHLLSVNQCTQADIFERLSDFYPIETAGNRTAYQRLRRDLLFLKNVGYEIKKRQDTDGTPSYTLLKGSGPVSPWLFNQQELAILAAICAMFVNSTHPIEVDIKQSLPTQEVHHPFAQDILQLVERLTAALSPQQKSYFKQCVQRPLIYFNVGTVTDYLSHRATIDAIAQIISRRQQLSFDYLSTPFQHSPTPHRQVDPYYLIQQDGHIYLIGYSHDASNPRKNRIFEWRIDRIKFESIKIQPRMVSGTLQPRPITFRYWADISLAKSGLSHRWITHEIEREEIVGEGSQRRHRLLVRAQAYSSWRIVQQLHKYGDKVELIDPPELLKQMRQEVKRTYDLYFQSGPDTP
jgi:WYL domain